MDSKVGEDVALTIFPDQFLGGGFQAPASASINVYGTFVYETFPSQDFRPQPQVLDASRITVMTYLRNEGIAIRNGYCCHGFNDFGRITTAAGIIVVIAGWIFKSWGAVAIGGMISCLAPVARGLEDYLQD